MIQKKRKRKERGKREREKTPHRQVTSRDGGTGVEQVAQGVDVVAGRADGDDDCFFLFFFRNEEAGRG